MGGGFATGFTEKDHFHLSPHIEGCEACCNNQRTEYNKATEGFKGKATTEPRIKGN
jgi:hypothetical protein